MTVAAGSHGLAALYTLRKDHKAHEDKEIGPPVRPVCRGSAAYNNKFSHLISSLLKHVWKDCATACENTEEILAEIRDINQHGIENDVVIGSLDVKALYPSLDVGFTAEIVAKEYRESQFEIEGIDYREVGLYLAISKTERELENLGLLEFCPRRKTKLGRPPVITGKATTSSKDEERYRPWKLPNKVPNKDVKKTMMSEALRVAIEYIMKNHVYKFNNTVKKQSQGGPIGLELTGELAAIFMMWWDRELLRRVHMLGLEVALYKRYVDDINLVVKTPREKKKLAKSRNGDYRLEMDHNPPETRDDVSYVSIVQEVGNGIHPSIQLEMDCPSLHNDQKLPLLDIKVWIEKQPEGENGEGCDEGKEGKGQSQIMHEYYYKEVATRAVVDARSAMPWRDKRTVITQDILRVLLRCSPDLPWSTTTMHVNEYIKRLQFSHYDERFREEVWRSALKAYNSIKEKDRNGEQPLYRPKNWQRTERKKIRRAKKEDWYKKGGNKTVIFVPSTPHSQLSKRYQEVIGKTNLKIKVVERSGKTVKSILHESDPYKQPGCSTEEDCMVCKGGRGKGNCRREGVTYEIRCNECNCVYVGETARTGHYRGQQHMTALTKRDQDSVLWRHTVQTHSNSDPPPQYSMAITSYQETALGRQITEAVKINNTPPELRLNTREEWGHTRLVRTSLTNL
ncbi:hypothetical protein ACOMHN_022003 [Nucella lapillus]